MKPNIVLSLCDYTGIFVEPWRDAGYECICVDIQHPQQGTHKNGIEFIGSDLMNPNNEIARLMDAGYWEGKIAFMAAFPSCDDMAVCGAKHMKKKGIQALIDSLQLVENCRKLCEKSKAKWVLENPISTLSTYWRKPDYYFHPYSFGGYLPEDDQHPLWPEYIMPRDAYPKKTCLWVSDDPKFIMPEQDPVEVALGYSKQFKKLGGKSRKTKNIRSATPRGLSIAICEANRGK